MKKLKNLDDHNVQQSIHWQLNSNQPQLNGIACPNCGEELYDSNPMITLTSYPAKKNIHCIKCDYSGYRIA
jgi:DNA-directed RNA polymerase subunit RPC12/RpoP